MSLVYIERKLLHVPPKQTGSWFQNLLNIKGQQIDLYFEIKHPSKYACIRWEAFKVYITGQIKVNNDFVRFKD